MTFASIAFFILLTITFSIYYFLPQRGRMILLLVASYFFYCFWNVTYGLLILISTTLDYAMALTIARAKTQRWKRAALLTSIISNLGILSYFKYTNFALDSLRLLLGPLGHHIPGPLDIVLPVGISFYTFQIMSYVIDVYRGEQEAERDFILVALYVSFFPQLVAGPIERAKDLMSQLKKKQTFAIHNIEEGGRQILWGLLKKVVVSDRLTYAALSAFMNPAAYDTGELLFSAFAMMIVVYLDFSAYSDMANGTAQLFGIRLSVNFNFPYAAGNIAEYWRRWHITMSTWVRDYLFKPLGGYRPRNLWHFGRTVLITMGLVGLWHGANWTYVLWGLAHGAALVFYHIFHILFLRKLRGSSLTASIPWRLGSWTLNTIIRMLINILFFSPDLKRAKIFYNRLLVHATSQGFYQSYVILGLILVITFWIFHFVQSRISFSEKLDALHPLVRATAYTAVFFVILFGAVDTAEQFIYFQF